MGGTQSNQASKNGKNGNHELISSVIVENNVNVDINNTDVIERQLVTTTNSGL
jgi:hypothetical protein